MKFISLFSGIGGFDLAFERVGMQCVAQVEIDTACQGVLAKHFPNTTRYNDVRQFGKHNIPTVDLVSGGFPCQDLSIAGRRQGLAGERSRLWFEFARIIDELEPGWVVIENVPGLLSSNNGRDFAIIIRWLAERGYGVAWRVLDAQYFGVPQRRRRVFIVGHLGDGRAAEVLFERESRPGDTPPGREAGERVAPTLSGSANSTGGDRPPGTQVETAESLVVAHETGKGFWTEGLPGLRGQPGGMPENLIANALSASPTATGRLDPSGEDFVVTGTLDRKSCGANRGSQANEHEFLVPISFDWQSGGDVWLNISDKPMLQKSQIPAIAYTIQQNDNGKHKRADRPNGGMYVKEADTSLTVGSTDQTVVAFAQNEREELRDLGDLAGAIQAEPGTHQQTFVVPFVGVRRLTPVECERLQGFPDGYTAGQSDSTRYRQLGNAVAVPVVEWIGRRIMAVLP